METRDAPKKLRRVKRLDCIRLDAKDRTYFTDEGYLVDHPILTSVGIFEYTNPDGSVRRELRLPEHVFAEESLKTYKGKPIIITHEAGVVSKDNVDREQIGTILTEGYRDGENVRAEIIIHNTDAMKDCGLKELSLGYNLDLIEEPGEWNGEAYDAIQTNIVINHLALVANARAGEQARLNIDSSDAPELKGARATAVKLPGAQSGHLTPARNDGIDEIKNKKGGKENVLKTSVNGDSLDLTPEELIEAIKSYKASKATGSPDGEENAEDAAVTEPEKEEAASEPEIPVPGIPETPGKPEKMEKDGEGIKALIPIVEQLLEGIKAIAGEGAAQTGTAMDGDGTEGCFGAGEPEDENTDGSDDQSRSMNADSADDVFRQRLSICRMGDILNLKGLEDKSILEGKKAIIAKVLPDIRLDGKGPAYLDAAYDLAVSNAGKRKDISYQKNQMIGSTPNQRMDGKNESMASTARQRMIEREGGKE